MTQAAEIRRAQIAMYNIAMQKISVLSKNKCEPKKPSCYDGRGMTTESCKKSNATTFSRMNFSSNVGYVMIFI